MLFTNQMYDRLGYQWAGMLLCFISLACCAIPFLFWVYGAKIRERSKYAYAGEDDDLNGSSGSSDEEKGKAPENNSTLVRDDYDRDEDLRRARSYVSNP